MNTRRSLLQLSGIGVASAFAGCLNSVVQNQSETEEDNEVDASPSETPQTESSPETDTETDTKTRVGPPPLDFRTEKLDDQSTETPARFRAILSNHGESTISVRFGPALLFTDNADDSLQWAERIVIVPESDRVVGSEPTLTDEGCWRFPEDGYLPIQSILETRRIEPEHSLSEAYRLYTDGSSPECLPPGEYRFQDKMAVYDSGQPLILTVVVTISDDQAVSTSAEMKYR